MFLSRLILNTSNRKVLIDIDDPYQMHRTISRAFGFGSKGEAGRVLWRCDSNSLYRNALVYVQSEISPEWGDILSYCPEYFEDTSEKNPACREISLQQFTFPQGTLLSFRLRANPTKKIKVEGKNNGCRVPLLKAEQQMEWISKKAEAGGFQIVMANVSEQRKYTCKPGSKKNITLDSILFDGTLQVIDSAAFLQTVSSGIGSAKGMGMGLLSIGPAI